MGSSDGLDPWQSNLAEDFCCGFEVPASLEQACSNDDLISQDSLMMIGMRRTVWAVEAIYWIARCACVRVLLDGISAFRERES